MTKYFLPSLHLYNGKNKSTFCTYFILKIIFIQAILSFFFETNAYSQDTIKNDSRNNDWPMFRNDAQRSGFTKTSLPDNLKLNWSRSFSALKPI